MFGPSPEIEFLDPGRGVRRGDPVGNVSVTATGWLQGVSSWEWGSRSVETAA